MVNFFHFYWIKKIEKISNEKIKLKKSKEKNQENFIQKAKFKKNTAYIDQIMNSASGNKKKLIQYWMK